MWLCIDQGGHSTRAAVFDERGAVVAESSAAVATHRAPPVYVEHDVEQMLGSASRCIAEVAEQLGTDTTRLRGIAIATQRSTLAVAARDGEALTPLISWQDRRGGADLDHFAGAAAAIKRITGLRLSPHYGVGKLRWCLQNAPRVRERRDAGDIVAAPLASLLAHALCREQPWVIDPVNASRTLLMDLRTAAWSDELLRLFEIPAALLPAIRPNRSRFGTVAVGGSAVPLTALVGDQSAAVFAGGMPETGAAFVNMGTGAFIQVATGCRPVEDDALLTSIVWQDDSELLYVLEGTVNGAASAIDAVGVERGIVCKPDAPALMRALAAIERAPLYLNGVSGLGSPDWVPDFPSRFVGEGDAFQCLAAVYESIAFLIQRNLERLTQRVPITRLRISGGLARHDWLAQRIADLSGLTVARPADTEATLAGLVYLASGGAVIVPSPISEFLPRHDPVAARRYRDWSRALAAVLADRGPQMANPV